SSHNGRVLATTGTCPFILDIDEDAPSSFDSFITKLGGQAALAPFRNETANSLFRYLKGVAEDQADTIDLDDPGVAVRTFCVLLSCSVDTLTDNCMHCCF
ncbi:MAG TPA: hypothetical protein V6C97_02560, partial [Oculatellaceae cyanobacterium]